MEWIYSLFSGRIAKSNYIISFCFLIFLLFLLITLAVIIVSFIGLKYASVLFYYPIAYTITAVIQFFAFSLHARRFHDLGRSGWWSFLFIIPLVNILILLVLLLSSGDEKANRFGEPQDTKTFDLLAVFNLKNKIKADPGKNTTSIINGK